MNNKPYKPYISFSSMNEFQCRRKYYLHQIVMIERKGISIPFVAGKILHTGVSFLFRKSKEYVVEAKKHYKTICDDAKNLILTDKEWKELSDVGDYIEGMLKGFYKKNAVFINKIQQVKNEVKLRLELDKGIFVGSIDNLFKFENQLWMHELKSAKELTEYRIDKIKTDLQHSAYYYVFHILHPKHKIHKIRYDIIRKPSIRQKQNETLEEYKKRLLTWYDGIDSSCNDRKFYSEPLDAPKLKESNVFNTLNHVADEMSRCKDIDDFYQNFDVCSDKYGKCQYFDICHRGNIPIRSILKAYYRKSKEVVEYWNTYGVVQPKGLIQIDRL